MMKEMTLRELTDALTVRDMIKRENEKNFRDAFFLNPLAMTITTMTGIIVKINEAFTRSTGYDKDDVYGHGVLELGLYKNSCDRKEIIKILRESGRMLHRKVTFVAKDGRDLDCVMSSQVIQMHGEDYILSVIADDSWRICT
jgi:PAS domain S-box-containing protein